MNNATETKGGWINHLSVSSEAGDFFAPVKLELNDSGKVSLFKASHTAYLPRPMRLDGRLVYALPGCRELVA